MIDSFDFQGADGRQLSGRLESPSGRVRGWALFAHCFTCGKDNLAAVRIARTLAAEGIGVLRFDFAGIGESEGEFSETSFASNVGDIVAACGAMAEHGWPVSLLIGHSLGGAAVLAAAGECKTVRAVATINAPFDVAHALAQFSSNDLQEIEREGSAEVRLAGRPFRVGKELIDSLRMQDQGKRIASLHRPLLILHAPTDTTVSLDHATQIFAAARHPKSFLSLEKADHLLTRKEDAARAAGLIAAWADAYVEPAPGKDPPVDVEAVETGKGKFQLRIQTGKHQLIADEPASFGGLDSGPSPFQLLGSALASCMTMTVRLYADQKGWPLKRIRTNVGHTRELDQSPRDRFDVRIKFEGDLDAEQRARMLEIAGKCPVHRALTEGARFTIMESADPAPTEPPEAHAEAMERVADRGP
ncbi:bifunctional alpha/beta hydrolase/OsmC family protein [Sphingomonas sp. NSE70-1]|uniref:Bifunctional alpha/beta hydrolase/OsmC family protein n=1 Tax=Sphingomonas caseinilyticus TaxID=2908205 RepID=A0ABT0RRU7_9SPHN|nr:bifunctional alpha/beta hydrolase/OsmC family protein [Sphingomonas caseinilyticus]MCL6697738.1 bifunctional alpha/beta hydrolase/OsmC family protein [Sphingomonas caseinilyticus]